jgi:hypothetical protein
MRWLGAGERILLTLWVGGMWGIGYIAAPTLFKVLDDRALAGTLAGHMFKIIAIIGMVVCALLLVSAVIQSGTRALRHWRAAALGVALAILAVNLFVTQPAIQSLRAEGIVPGSANEAQFKRLHGLSSILYLVVSLTGLALVAGDSRRWSSGTPADSPDR